MLHLGMAEQLLLCFENMAVSINSGSFVVGVLLTRPPLVGVDIGARDFHYRGTESLGTRGIPVDDSGMPQTMWLIYSWSITSQI